MNDERKDTWKHACICEEHNIEDFERELPRGCVMCGCCGAQESDYDKWSKIPRYQRIHLIASSKFEDNGFRAWQYMCYPYVIDGEAPKKANFSVDFL